VCAGAGRDGSGTGLRDYGDQRVAVVELIRRTRPDVMIMQDSEHWLGLTTAEVLSRAAS
jgi:hypothetical protein